MHERGIRNYANDDIGARYGRRYTIGEPTVTCLAERVEALLHLTEERCNEKIATRLKAANCHSLESNMAKAFGTLSKITGQCIACHNAYRIR